MFRLITVVWCCTWTQFAYADTACHERGGNCQDSLVETCDVMFGQYVSGLCSGPNDIQCCAPYMDPNCEAVEGICQSTSLSCFGSYQVGLCSGPNDRRCCVPPAGYFTLRGDIKRLSPTGLSSGGVAASQNAAKQDMREFYEYKSCFYSIGGQYRIHPSLIAALASRESRVGRLLKATNGWGDYRNGEYHGYGILQCDIYTSGIGSECLQYPWDSCELMSLMINRVLLAKYAEVTAPGHPASSWIAERQVQAAVAAYNFGSSNVRTWEGLDIGTSGNDYSNDVMARAQYLINNMGWA